MPTYKACLFKITALTNLHVGSGSQNYGIIDNLIQRDPLTGYPYIQASSLKGALRQFCVEQWGRDDADLQFIFGRETLERSGQPAPDDNSAGKFRFFDARLLSLPIRSDQVPYFNLTSPALIDDLLATAKQFDLQLPDETALNLFKKEITGKIAVGAGQGQPAILENTDITALRTGFNPMGITQFFGDRPALITNQHNDASLTEVGYQSDLFGLLCDDFHLPVIARNKLSDGMSDGLWYEQILPRQTRFYFAVLYPTPTPATKDQPPIKNPLTRLKEALTVDTVQIGANASIGYGFCEISSLTATPLEKSKSTSFPAKP